MRKAHITDCHSFNRNQSAYLCQLFPKSWGKVGDSRVLTTRSLESTAGGQAINKVAID